MSRPRDWSALGAPSDPVPGDPDAIQALAGELRRTARAITQTADLLRRGALASGWRARAAVEFRGRAVVVAGRIERAVDRYEAAAAALAGYAPVLRECQRRADRALATARAGDLGGARRGLAAAVADRDEAARRAAGRIGSVVAHDGVHDTWKDRVCAIVARLATAAGDLAFAAGTAALFLSWIPVVGPVLAAGLSAVSTWAGMVALAGHLFLLLEGEGDMSTVAMDVVGIATAGVARSYARLSAESALSARALARSTEAARLRAADPGVDRWTVYRAVNRATGGPAGPATVGRPGASRRPGPGRGPASVLDPGPAFRIAVTGYRADVGRAVRTVAGVARPGRAGGARPARLVANRQLLAAARITPLASALAVAGERELAADLVTAAQVRPDLASVPGVAAYLAHSRMRGAIALAGWVGGAVLTGQDAAKRLAVAVPAGPGRVR